MFGLGHPPWIFIFFSIFQKKIVFLLLFFFLIYKDIFVLLKLFRIIFVFLLALGKH
jgi:hypothetical protein